jgi:hypothetical protein
LPTGARFAELVALAQQLRSADATAGGCLLERTPEGFRLAADLLSAFDPIPDAPASLESFSDRPEARVAVLGAFGPGGASDAAIVLAPFTTTPPALAGAPVVALLQSVEGVALRYSTHAATDADSGLSPSQAVPRLLASAPADAALYVTAEAGTPLAELYALLAELPDARPTALAVALPAGTRLPPPPEPAAAARCAEGLPELPEDAPLGDLEPAALGATLSALRQSATSCMRALHGAGKLTLALRVDAGGRVSDACAIESDVTEGVLATCLTESARQLRFPAPSPPGFVDLHLPLTLMPSDLQPQNPVCR